MRAFKRFWPHLDKGSKLYRVWYRYIPFNRKQKVIEDWGNFFANNPEDAKRQVESSRPVWARDGKLEVFGVREYTTNKVRKFWDYVNS